MDNCNGFEINSENSDAKCFVNTYIKSNEKSKKKVEENPSICRFCVYNKKYEYVEYDEWLEIKKRGKKNIKNGKNK